MEATAAAVAFWQLAKDANTLYTKLTSAEEDFQYICDNVSKLERHCERIAASYGTRIEPSLAPLITTSRELVQDFRKSAKNYNGKLRWRDTLGLAVKDVQRFEKLRVKLRDLADLASMQHIIHTQKAIREQMDTMATAEQVAELDRMMRGAIASQECTGLSRLQYSHENDTIAKRIQNWSWTSPQVFSSWFGLRGTIIGKRRRGRDKLIMTGRFELPFLHRMLYSNILFQNASFHVSGTYSSIVTEGDAFISACLDGNKFAIRQHCREVGSVPHVVTATDMTPLLYAVQSGRADAVEELLRYGADVNRCGGPKQISPIQCAIKFNHLDVVRILMRARADLDYVSSIGWSPIFYCWPNLEASWINRTEIIKLLLEYSNLVTQEADTMAWTALQRVAAFGTKEDMSLMLKIWQDLGGDHRWKSQPIDWEVIHYAVRAGNLPTFEVLLDLYGDEAKGVLDARGWSLLHMAVERTCEGPIKDASFDPMMIIRHLLRAGCDPNQRTPPIRVQDLGLESYTPEDLARKTGEDFHATYLKLLEELGISHGEADELYFDCV